MKPITNSSGPPSPQRPSLRPAGLPLWLYLLLILGLAGCNFPQIGGSPGSTQPAITYPGGAPSTPEIEITFRVTVPPNTPELDVVYLNILDEVTGLALNIQSYEMEAVAKGEFALALSFPPGSVVKYRYSRVDGAAPAEEHLSDGRQVRYRLYHAVAPGVVQDVVSRWTDTPFTGPSGRIMGEVKDAATGQPLPNLLVAAGGAQALTTSDGAFLIEGLPPGTHNLVVYALDGSYRTFQQGALVAAEATTPAFVRMEPAPLVNVTFALQAPENTTPAVPVRIAGGLYQFGNTFADLSGGFNTLAARMPALNLQPDFRYTLTVPLPAGADLRYLYTLGDGFWNTERTAAGGVPVRQLIVPESEITVQDTVASWFAGETQPVTFDITVPADTPPAEQISIQFSPIIGWTAPLPMWRLGANRWVYVLNSPLNARTPGPQAQGLPLGRAAEGYRVVDTVESWAGWQLDAAGAEVAPPPVPPRGPDFWAGVEFQANFHPSWTPRFNRALEDVGQTNSNWVVLAPTWSYTHLSPPILEQVTGRDPLWPDLEASIWQAHEWDLHIALYPTPRFAMDADAWWQSAPRDFPWWVSWFERYAGFLEHHADLAARTQAQALIIGGEWLNPALPGGLLADGTPSGVPVDADRRWRKIIADLRARYIGPIYWALPYEQATNPPDFLQGVYGFYVEMDAPLAQTPDADQGALLAGAAQVLDEQIQPLLQHYEKPLVLAVRFAGLPAGRKRRLFISCAARTAQPRSPLHRPRPGRTGRHLHRPADRREPAGLDRRDRQPRLLPPGSLARQIGLRPRQTGREGAGGLVSGFSWQRVNRSSTSAL